MTTTTDATAGPAPAKPSLKQRATDGFARLRQRRSFVDHLVRMQEHYGKVAASQQAGAITYFGFLSFFPILALAFFVVGYLAAIYPAAEGNLVDAINQVLPGLVGNGPDEISLTSVQDAAGAVGLIGLAGVLYSGLGWISSLRDALEIVFEKPPREQPNFVFGKLRDLATLALIGAVLIVSVAVSGIVTSSSGALLRAVGLGDTFAPLLSLLAVAVGMAASTVLFFTMFLLLAQPHGPRRPVWQGALLGAVGFEVLKQLSSLLLASTKNQPAFQAFGIALILVVWINYFSRVVLYAAAFAHTAPAARAAYDAETAAAEQGLPTASTAPAAAGAPPSSIVVGAAPARHARAAGGDDEHGDWREAFVHRIDDADPDEVGEDSAAASRAAVAAERRTARQRLLALGAAGTAAGVAALTFWRRRG